MLAFVRIRPDDYNVGVLGHLVTETTSTTKRLEVFTMTRRRVISHSMDVIGLLLMSSGFVLHSMVCLGLGSVIGFVGIMLLMTDRTPVNETASLSDWARSQIGPGGACEFSIVLEDGGSNKIVVIKWLRVVFTALGYALHMILSRTRRVSCRQQSPKKKRTGLLLASANMEQELRS
jgi:hypothetical protein